MKKKLPEETLVKKTAVLELLNIGKTKLYELIALDAFPYYNLGATGGRPDYRFKISEVVDWREQRKCSRN